MEQMDGVTAAQADRVIGRVDSAQQSIISIVTSSTTANKPDLSVVAELKSIIATQNTKIDLLTTLVNGQGVLLQKLTTKVSELTERVDQLPSAPPSLSQDDRALLSSQADLLTSQGVLINSMAAILQQLLAANLLSSSRAMAEGENVVAAAGPATADEGDEGEDKEDE